MTIRVQEEDRLSKKRAEKAHLTTTALGKKNSNKRKSRFHKRNDQVNNLNSSNSQNEQTILRNKELASFTKGRGIQRQLL